MDEKQLLFLGACAIAGSRRGTKLRLSCEDMDEAIVEAHMLWRQLEEAQSLIETMAQR